MTMCFAGVLSGHHCPFSSGGPAGAVRLPIARLQAVILCRIIVHLHRRQCFYDISGVPHSTMAVHPPAA